MGTAASKRRAERKRDYLLQTLDDHQCAINCMALSDDGSVLATGSDDHQIRLWSTKTTPVECLCAFIGHQDYITQLVFSENYLISASADQTMRKWDVTSGECLWIFTGHTSLINRIHCSGELLFSTSYDRTARCWDVHTGACRQVFQGHKHGILPILYLPSTHDLNSEDDFEEEMNIYTKDLVITGSQDTTAKVWSVQSGDCLRTLQGHIGAILCLALDNQGKILFTGSGDNSIRVWDVHRGTELRIYDQHQGAIIQLLVANKLLYSISADHTGRCWVIDVGDCTRVYKGHHHSVSCLQLDRNYVYTGCGDAIVRCFEARSGVLKRSFKSHHLAINCIEIVQDRLFSGSVDGSLKVWDISDFKDPIMTTSKSLPDERILAENRSDNDSGIDDREYRERRVHQMV